MKNPLWNAAIVTRGKNVGDAYAEGLMGIAIVTYNRRFTRPVLWQRSVK